MMNITIILVLDDDDLETGNIKSINGFPSDNPCLYQEINCNESTFKLYLLHIGGKDEIGIKFQGNALTFDSQPKIVIEGKCLVAVSHLNYDHSDTRNHYFNVINFNGIPVRNVPVLDDTFTDCWKRINENPLIALGGIPGEGYELIIDRFNSLNCDIILRTFGNLLKER
jgi:hypothetical protein